MKTGLSHEMISHIFGVEDRISVTHFLTEARDALTRHFVPKYLGLSHKTKQDLVENYSSKLASELLSNKPGELLVIFDGTYIYCQKSSNYGFKKKTYSPHKFRNLVKPMIMVTTAGYIIEVWGELPATKNDAQIIKDLFKTSEFSSFMKSGDIRSIVDRGFKTCVEDFEKNGIPVNIPQDKGSQKQLSVIQANETRLVTKVRWVIEAINGLLKKSYRYLDKVIQNKSLPHVNDDVRIACALVNYTYRRLVAEDDDIEVAKHMKTLVNKPNLLYNLVKEK
jgi:hypothetical protein